MSGLEERKSFTVFGATFYYDHSWPRSTSSINNSSLIYRCIAFCVSIHQRQIHSIRPAWDNTLSRFMLLVGDPFCGGDNETMLLNYSNGCLVPFMKPLTFLQTMVAVVVLVAGPRTLTQQHDEMIQKRTTTTYFVRTQVLRGYRVNGKNNRCRVRKNF